MNEICFSTCRQFVQGWNNGNLCISASISINGLHGAMGACLYYLRTMGGEEPVIESELKKALDKSDALLTKLAYGKTYEW